MRKVITYTQTQGEFAGQIATCVPCAQEDVAKVLPEVASMTEAEYFAWIIARDVNKNNPENVQIVEVED
jgi:hypothetical protein